MRIDLHLGVHKTSTTHLQRYWLTCSETAGAAACAPTREVRTNLTRVSRLANEEDGDSATQAERGEVARKWLATWQRDSRGLVLSDENIIGNCVSLFDKESLYLSALPRLQRVAQALGEHEVRVWMCVREYAGFVRSAYCEMLRHSTYKPFRQATKNFKFSERGWEHLVADVRQAFPGSELNCWGYEAIQSVRPAITAKLFGLDAASLPEPDNQRDRPSVSKMAVELLDHIHKRHDRETASRVSSSVARIVGGDEMPGFDPWDDEQRKLFASAYEKSKAAIQRQSGVNWLS